MSPYMIVGESNSANTAILSRELEHNAELEICARVVVDKVVDR